MNSHSGLSIQDNDFEINISEQSYRHLSSPVETWEAAESVPTNSEICIKLQAYLHINFAVLSDWWILVTHMNKNAWLLCRENDNQEKVKQMLAIRKPAHVAPVQPPSHA